jgi:two-component system chemotaxis response regulator CheY
MGLLDRLFNRPQKRRILVVDDDPDVRNLVSDLLNIEGYEVHMAVDGMEGLAKLKKGGFDLLISDINMPRLTGPELLKVIRASPDLKSQPVMMLSSEGMIDTLNDVFAMGVVTFIPKPFQAHELLTKVSAFFASRKPRDPLLDLHGDHGRPGPG